MSDIRQAPTTAHGLFHEALDDVVSTTKYWWLLLVTGAAWVVIAVLILRFDYTTVAAIAVLFGVFCFAAAANEVMVAAVSSSRGWRRSSYCSAPRPSTRAAVTKAIAEALSAQSPLHPVDASAARKANRGEPMPGPSKPRILHRCSPP